MGWKNFLERWPGTTRELKKKRNDHEIEAELEGFLAASHIQHLQQGPRKTKSPKGEAVVSVLLVRSMSFPDADHPGILSISMYDSHTKPVC